MQNINMDEHYPGTFNIGGEKLNGELIYNKEHGIIMLFIVKQFVNDSLGKHYSNLDVITGVLNSGTTVTLFHNRCTKNQTHVFQSQQIVSVADYSIWSKNNATNKKYNKMTCVLENALQWSGMSSIDTSGVYQT